jgi:hypothetical protein
MFTIYENDMKLCQEAQALFDISINGVIEQGGRSVNNQGSCVYREPYSKRKCAVGHLIPDDEYTPNIENVDMGSILADNDIIHKSHKAYPFKSTKIVKKLKPHFNLVKELQRWHDDGTELFSRNKATPHCVIVIKAITSKFGLHTHNINFT